jgi:hypothetical protein
VNLPGKHFSLVTIKKGPSLAVFLFDSNGLFVARPCKVETKMRQLQCLEGSLVVTLPDKEFPALTEHTLGLEHLGLDSGRNAEGTSPCSDPAFCKEIFE